MVGYGRLRSVAGGYGRLQSVAVGCGRLRSLTLTEMVLSSASTACALPSSLIKVFQATSSHVKAKALTFHAPRSIALFEPPIYAPAHASFPRQSRKGRPTRPTHGCLGR